MRFHLYIFFAMFCVLLFFLLFFSLCLFDVQPLLRNTCQKNDNRGWLTRWPPRSFANPIWHDTAPLFVYTDQLLCHCFHLISCSLLVGLLHAMAFIMLLLVGWVIWNNKPLSLPLSKNKASELEPCYEKTQLWSQSHVYKNSKVWSRNWLIFTRASQSSSKYLLQKRICSQTDAIDKEDMSISWTAWASWIFSYE